MVGVEATGKLAARERARRERRSIGDVLSNLARQALTGQHPGAGNVEPEEFFGFKTFSPRGPTVSNALIDQLREDDGE